MLNRRLAKGEKEKRSIDDIMSRALAAPSSAGRLFVDSRENSLPQILGANERNFMEILRWGKISPRLPWASPRTPTISLC